MSMRIDASRWSAHTALVHLRKDSQKLAADVAAGADQRVLAADRAALIESRRELHERRRTGLVDVTA